MIAEYILTLPPLADENVKPRKSRKSRRIARKNSRLIQQDSTDENLEDILTTNGNPGQTQNFLNDNLDEVFDEPGTVTVNATQQMDQDEGNDDLHEGISRQRTIDLDLNLDDDLNPNNSIFQDNNNSNKRNIAPKNKKTKRGKKSSKSELEDENGNIIDITGNDDDESTRIETTPQSPSLRNPRFHRNPTTSPTNNPTDSPSQQDTQRTGNPTQGITSQPSTSPPTPPTIPPSLRTTTTPTPSRNNNSGGRTRTPTRYKDDPDYVYEDEFLNRGGNNPSRSPTSQPTPRTSSNNNNNIRTDTRGTGRKRPLDIVSTEHYSSNKKPRYDGKVTSRHSTRFAEFDDHGREVKKDFSTSRYVFTEFMEDDKSTGGHDIIPDIFLGNNNNRDSNYDDRRRISRMYDNQNNGYGSNIVTFTYNPLFLSPLFASYPTLLPYPIYFNLKEVYRASLPIYFLFLEYYLFFIKVLKILTTFFPPFPPPKLFHKKLIIYPI